VLGASWAWADHSTAGTLDPDPSGRLNPGSFGQGNMQSLTLTWTVAGLVVEIVGVLIIFKWGPPQPGFSEGVSLGLEDDNVLDNGRTVRQHTEDARRTRRTYRRLSGVGLVLIMIGLGFQLFDALTQPPR
jgi:hypothetical protein